MKSFKKIAQGLTAKQILTTLTASLREPTTVIDMSTFGEIKEGMCVGCGVTNMICRLMGITLEELMKLDGKPSKLYEWGSDEFWFLTDFEIAINGLRMGGSVSYYNKIAKIIGIATIKNPDSIKLPSLDDDYSEIELKAYDDLAERQ